MNPKEVFLSSLYRAAFVTFLDTIIMYALFYRHYSVGRLALLIAVEFVFIFFALVLYELIFGRKKSR